MGLDLKTGRLFWPTQNRKFVEHCALARDTDCEVAIIGGGLSGALAAYLVVGAGFDTILLDKREVAGGSTGASTALIQYEIDVPLFKLIKMRGEKAAVRSFRLCFEAIGQLESTVEQLGGRCRFKRRKSLYLARRKGDVADLQAEFAVRKKFGFELAYLSQPEIEGAFSFSAAGALFSAQAAELDPCRFTQRLIKHAQGQGLRVFTQAEVTQVEHSRSGVTLRTRSAARVRARRVILAAGYESADFLRRKLVRLRSTYVLTTQPVADFAGWEDRCLIWETGRPYHYLRTTHDNRIMIGGGDEDFVSAEKRNALLGKKVRLLHRKVDRFFPHLRLEPAFAWAGTFGDTKDGLPYIGSLPASPRILYMLCYGANGTNFGMIGANLARDWVEGKGNRDAKLFALDR